MSFLVSRVVGDGVKVLMGVSSESDVKQAIFSIAALYSLRQLPADRRRHLALCEKCKAEEAARFMARIAEEYVRWIVERIG